MVKSSSKLKSGTLDPKSSRAFVQGPALSCCSANSSAEHRALSCEFECAGGEVIPASRVVLAVGHSSRAMYQTLRAKGIALSPKPFALGLRVEHPQALIDSIQYGQEYAAG